MFQRVNAGQDDLQLDVVPTCDSTMWVHVNRGHPLCLLQDVGGLWTAARRVVQDYVRSGDTAKQAEASLHNHKCF